MISATCLKPMLSSEPVLLVSFCHEVERISPETMPHKISLVVGTSRFDTCPATVAAVVVVVVPVVLPVVPAVPVVPEAAPVVVVVVVVFGVAAVPEESSLGWKLPIKPLRSV